MGNGLHLVCCGAVCPGAVDHLVCHGIGCGWDIFIGCCNRYGIRRHRECRCGCGCAAAGKGQAVRSRPFLELLTTRRIVRRDRDARACCVFAAARAVVDRHGIRGCGNYFERNTFIPIWQSRILNGDGHITRQTACTLTTLGSIVSCIQQDIDGPISVQIEATIEIIIRLT